MVSPPLRQNPQNRDHLNLQLCLRNLRVVNHLRRAIAEDHRLIDARPPVADAPAHLHDPGLDHHQEEGPHEEDHRDLDLQRTADLQYVVDKGMNIVIHTITHFIDLRTAPHHRHHPGL